MNSGISISELLKKYLEESGKNQPILPGMTRPPQPAPSPSTSPAQPPAGRVQSKFNKGYSYQPEPLADEIAVPGREKRGMAKKPFHKEISVSAPITNDDDNLIYPEPAYAIFLPCQLRKLIGKMQDVICANLIRVRVVKEDFYQCNRFIGAGC